MLLPKEKELVDWTCHGIVLGTGKVCPQRDTCMHYTLGLLLIASGAPEKEPEEDAALVQKEDPCYIDAADTENYTPSLYSRDEAWQREMRVEEDE